ncbi:RIP metalloprotease RseP [Hippea maritima]|uniref:Zinc metalloprotease n=1 Tax=Hippea maritima (strain ATCC 700847 / DSM 10411 / MH2) TaxID=760142 RepID=F2LTT5_HIPMA|nr:RIP metalloprotease RseP [Hippea maritima]AEA34461.1 membrane-associated zinc metalloprotease [Hippea maritima DSM 10411]
MSWLWGIVGLVLMVIIHEFGHFIVARLLGVGVERFSVGFGPILFRFKPKKTEYAFSLILLGGYVKLKGESFKDDDAYQPDSFVAQPLWKRVLIVFAGPFFNIVSAVVFIALAYNIGITTLAPTVGKVMKNSPAQAAGIHEGDIVVAIDGKSVRTWKEMAKLIKLHPNKMITLKIKRGDKLIALKATPKSVRVKDVFGKEVLQGRLGIAPSGDTVKLRYGPIESVQKGIQETIYMTKLIIVGLVKLIERVIPTSEIGGPIMIIDFAGKAASAGLGAFLWFIAVISINLGILNLLPIPVLDGGHLLFYTIEAVRGKPVSEKAQENFQKIGIALLLALMLFAFVNDFRRYGVVKFVKHQIEQKK